MEQTKFKVNKTYMCRSLCDYDCIWEFTVTKRTDKSIWISDGKNTKRVKVYNYGNDEMCYPLGKYSMCPVLRSSREA